MAFAILRGLQAFIVVLRMTREHESWEIESIFNKRDNHGQADSVGGE